MSTMAPTYSVTSDLAHQRIDFAASGFFDAPTMKAFLRQIDGAAQPLVASGKPFTALGTMSGLTPQSGEVVETIARHLQAARAAGLMRVAIVDAPPMLALQYRRAAGDLTVEFFEEDAAARRWLADDPA